MDLTIIHVFCERIGAKVANCYFTILANTLASGGWDWLFIFKEGSIMKDQIRVSKEFIDSFYKLRDQWKREDLNSIGSFLFIENDLYLEIAAHGNIVLCKNKTDPRKRIIATTYRDKTPAGMAKMLAVYLKELNSNGYWD